MAVPESGCSSVVRIEIVGDDPADFAETFAEAYSGKRWIDKERERLNKSIEDAEREEPK